MSKRTGRLVVATAHDENIYVLQYGFMLCVALTKIAQLFHPELLCNSFLF